MSANTHKVNVWLVDVDGDFPDSLGSVSVEENSFLSAKLANLIHVLDYTDLVVDVHGTNAENFFLRLLDSFFKELNIKNAAFLYGQISDSKSLQFEISASIENAFMFNLSGNDVFSFGSIEAG